MLKLQRIRGWIGLIAVLAFAVGVFSMQDRLVAWWTGGRSSLTGGPEERDWRQQELGFLKSIYDRLERQRQEAGGNAPASLRREQEAILQRITETARPIRNKVPADVAALLSDPAATSTTEKPEPRDAPGGAAPPPAGSAVASVPPMFAPAAPPPALPEVRIDPASIPRIEVDLSPLSRPPEPDRPAERIVKLREPRPAKPAEEKKPVEAKAKESKPGEAKPAESKPAEPKPAEAKAGDTKSEAKPKAKAAKPKPAAAAPEASGTAKE